MAFNTFVSNFRAGSSLDNPKSFTGLGFQPDVIIPFNSRVATATNNEFAAHAGLRIGVSDGTTEMGIESTASDAVSTTNTDRRLNNESLVVSTQAGALNKLGTFSSFDSDGFTVDFTTAPSGTDEWGYLALGGVTNVAVNEFLVTIGGAQNQSITGLGFQPTCIIFLNAQTGAPDAAIGDGSFTLGFATASDEEACISGFSDDAVTTTQTTRSQRTDRCTMWQTTGFLRTANFVSMDADGFTIHWNEFSVQSVHIAWIAFAGGGSFFVGNETSPTSAGTKATTGVGFQTGALLTAYFNLAATSTVQDHMRLGIGASSIDSDDEYCCWMGDTDNLSSSSADSAGSEPGGTPATKVIGHINTDAPSSWDEEADVDSFDTDGFTLDWTAADATARQFIYLACEGTAVATTFVPQIIML